ncbi:hypothetical protein NECID01_2090 [Nematocida sp. AWRm77]|nr:hypothetical protein NECID01_2090 [Nematocida sp. AWRm77]
MKTIRMIFMFIAFATICISQIEIDLMLRNKTSIRIPVPKGAFHTIDEANLLIGSHSDNDGPSSPKKAKTEDNVWAAPYEFEDISECVQFRQLWDTSLPPLTAQYNPLLQEQTDISIAAVLFEKFLLTADFLDIQGEYAERFAENMVKYGLLGRYSADIIASKVFSARDLSYDIFWVLLHAFLRQTGFKYRLTHPSIGQTMLRIEKADAWPRKIDKEYTGPFQETKMRTVLYSKLGPESSQEKERNEAVLVWLLLNVGGSSVDIQYFIKVVSDNVTDLSQIIQNFSKENNKRACVYVEGVSLIPNYSYYTTLSTALQLVPNLSRLKLFIAPPCTPNIELSSLVRSIILCRSLKALEIRGLYLDNTVSSRIVESFPGILQLCFYCEILEDTATESLKKCTQLEKLELDGEYQSSAAVQELVSHLPSLKKLIINCEVLEPAATESFKNCAQLEELTIDGRNQLSATVKALLNHLSSLKTLIIMCNSLEPEAIESFKNCAQLEKLELDGECQSSSAVQELVSHLPSLKELVVVCKVLEDTAAESFKNCAQLEKLKVYGEYQSSAAVQELVSHLLFLKKLVIVCEVLEPEAIESFKNCAQLEKLELDGEYQSSSAVQELVSHLPSLKKLIINCEVLEDTAAESFKNCAQLDKLEIKGKVQKCSTVKILLSHLSSLKRLSIRCNRLTPTAVKSFKKCSQLEKLKIDGGFQSIRVMKALISHLPSLKELFIKCQSLDSTVAESFQACKNLKKLEMCGHNHPSVSFLIKLLEVLQSLQYLKINIDTAELALAGALRTCCNLHSLELRVKEYIPGFVASYLQDPLPSLAFLKLIKTAKTNKYSKEDRMALKKAREMGICIKS